MGRVILPELLAALVLLVLCGLVLVGIGAAQWMAGSAITQRLVVGRGESQALPSPVALICSQVSFQLRIRCPRNVLLSNNHRLLLVGLHNYLVAIPTSDAYHIDYRTTPLVPDPGLPSSPASGSLLTFPSSSLAGLPQKPPHPNSERSSGGAV